MTRQFQNPPLVLGGGSGTEVGQVAGSRHADGICNPSGVKVRAKRAPHNSADGKRLKLHYQRPRGRDCPDTTGNHKNDAVAVRKQGSVR